MVEVTIEGDTTLEVFTAVVLTLTTVGTLGLFGVTLLQLRTLRQERLDSRRPYLVVNRTRPQPGGQIWIEATNVGSGPALHPEHRVHVTPVDENPSPIEEFADALDLDWDRPQYVATPPAVEGPSVSRRSFNAEPTEHATGLASGAAGLVISIRSRYSDQFERSHTATAHHWWRGPAPSGDSAPGPAVETSV